MNTGGTNSTSYSQIQAVVADMTPTQAAALDAKPGVVVAKDAKVSLVNPAPNGQLKADAGPVPAWKGAPASVAAFPRSPPRGAWTGSISGPPHWTADTRLRRGQRGGVHPGARHRDRPVSPEFPVAESGRPTTLSVTATAPTTATGTARTWPERSGRTSSGSPRGPRCTQFASSTATAADTGRRSSMR